MERMHKLKSRNDCGLFRAEGRFYDACLAFEAENLDFHGKQTATMNILECTSGAPPTS